MEGIKQAYIETPKDPEVGKKKERENLTSVTATPEPEKNFQQHLNKVNNEYFRLTAEANHRLRRLMQIYFSFQLEYPREKVRANEAVAQELVSYNYEDGERKGLESAFRTALYYLENSRGENEDIVTSDYLDAFYKVDLLRVIYDEHRASIKELYLIQVKSREMKSEYELNEEISSYSDIQDTDYNESDKEYLAYARLKYKALVAKKLQELNTFNLPDKVKKEILEEIQNNTNSSVGKTKPDSDPIRNPKTGKILKRPETLEEVHKTHGKLLEAAKDLFTKKEKTVADYLANLNLKLNQERVSLTKEIFTILLSDSPSLDLTKQSQEYLQVFRTFLDIANIKDKKVRFNNLAILYVTNRLQSEELEIKNLNPDEVETWFELLNITKDKLESVLEYLVANKYDLVKIIDQQKKSADLEAKSNIITAQKVFSVIAYPDKYGGITEMSPESIS